MVTINFPDIESKRRALGLLAERFSFTNWVGRELTVPDAAVAALSREAIPFEVDDDEPVPTYEEVMAEYERGETLDIVDAFAEIVGVDRETWLRQVEEHKAKRIGPVEG